MSILLELQQDCDAASNWKWATVGSIFTRGNKIVSRFGNKTKCGHVSNIIQRVENSVFTLSQYRNPAVTSLSYKSLTSIANFYIYMHSEYTLIFYFTKVSYNNYKFRYINYLNVFLKYYVFIYIVSNTKLYKICLNLLTVFLSNHF